MSKKADEVLEAVSKLEVADVGNDADQIAIQNSLRDIRLYLSPKTKNEIIRICSALLFENYAMKLTLEQTEAGVAPVSTPAVEGEVQGG